MVSHCKESSRLEVQGDRSRQGAWTSLVRPSAGWWDGRQIFEASSTSTHSRPGGCTAPSSSSLTWPPFTVCLPQPLPVLEQLSFPLPLSHCPSSSLLQALTHTDIPSMDGMQDRQQRSHIIQLQLLEAPVPFHLCHQWHQTTGGLRRIHRHCKFFFLYFTANCHLFPAVFCSLHSIFLPCLPQSLLFQAKLSVVSSPLPSLSSSAATLPSAPLHRHLQALLTALHLDL